MPLPFIIGAAAAAAAVAGVGSGISGAVKMKDANDTIKSANSQHEENIARFEKQNEKTGKAMDKLGKKELEILQSFEEFSNVLEKIQGRPKFKEYSKEGVKLPEYDPEELKEVSVGAGVLLGGIGGAAVGTAGGFAAAGATTAAVMALGTASTGTAIASLSGAAATNATLAALGGGAVTAGGGGILLGTTVLSAATLGVGLLVGGVIFNVTGSSLSGKADEAYAQMKKAEKEINTICSYMKKLKSTCTNFYHAVSNADEVYQAHLGQLKDIVEVRDKRDWALFSEDEKLVTQNTVLLVSLLYNMCKVKLVLTSEAEEEMNQINAEEVKKTIENSEEVLREIGEPVIV